MKKYLTLIAAALLLISACEFDFTPEIDSGPKLFVKCVAMNDSICAQVKYAAPSSDAQKIQNVSAAHLELAVNGQTFSIDLDDNGTGTAIKQVKEGDLISINAGMTGLNDVYGYTEMPGLPEISDVKVENNVLIDSISYTVLHLKTDRKPDPDDYYAVHIIEERTMTFPDTLIVDTTFVRAMIQSGDDGVPEFASLNDNNGLFPFIKAPVILFPASAFKHNECALSLLSFGFIFPDMTLRSRYKLLVSKVSEEFYLYSMSLYKSSGDILATLGLAPPQFAWSNIEGGLGFCGALATIETDWYE